MCTSSHVTKIAGLEEKLVRQAGMLEEVVDKVLVVIIILKINMISSRCLHNFISLYIIIILACMLFKVPAMVEDFNSKLKGDDSKGLIAMDEKVKVAELKLKKVEEESRAKEADMHKVYDLVNRLLD